MSQPPTGTNIKRQASIESILCQEIHVHVRNTVNMLPLWATVGVMSQS